MSNVTTLRSVERWLKTDKPGAVVGLTERRALQEAYHRFRGVRTGNAIALERFAEFLKHFGIQPILIEKGEHKGLWQIDLPSPSILDQWSVWELLCGGRVPNS